jgi:hypothetical protein
MKNIVIICLLLFYGMSWAQEIHFADIPSTNAIQHYLSETKEFAALFNGKVETPYDRPLDNHPYFETNRYVSGTLCYNQVVYSDVLMRFDLYRDVITVSSPDKPYPIVLQNAMFNYAILNGSTITLSVNENDSKEKFLVLLHNGIFPVVRKYKVEIISRESDRKLIRSFLIQNKYAIYIDGIPYPVKNKNSILKLFADRKKELNEFAKQHKLNFKEQIEESIIALVNQYERLINVGVDNYMSLP